MQKLSNIAGKKFAVLSLVLASSMAAESLAHAAEKIKIDTRIEKDTSDGHVLYISGDQGQKDIGGERVREFVSAISVVDQGDPKVKGDEFKASEKFLRVEKEDGKGETILELNADGLFRPEKNPFGQISGFPESVRKAKNPTFARERVNATLRNFAIELMLLRSLEAVGKGDTAEAKYAQQKLENGIKNFQKQHPNIPISNSALGQALAIPY